VEHVQSNVKKISARMDIWPQASSNLFNLEADIQLDGIDYT